eukprot:TRINITY_DN2017_c0_g1_i1.p1 TRINITY_DN2017_c0_g1~~TRINITY_DN2017_c0_g1_i1.p1  ORF type:complete len:574 (-),score=69.22 TRINITY_DN2017_c0_g1_i1:347-2068(-)
MGRTATYITGFLTFNLAIVLFLVGFYYACGLFPVQEFFREVIYLKPFVMVVKGGAEASNAITAIPFLIMCRYVGQLTMNNKASQMEVVNLEGLKYLVIALNQSTVDEHHTTVLKGGALFALESLIQDNSENMATLLEEGGIPSLIEIIKKESGTSVATQAARLLATIAAQSESQFQIALYHHGAIETLLTAAAESEKGEGKAMSLWAVANTVSYALEMQDQVRQLDAIEPIVRLLWSGQDKLVSQVGVHVLGNLAAHNAANQDAIREAGGIEAIVKLLESCLESYKNQTSNDITVQEIQQLIEAAKTQDAVRQALEDMGGLETLAQLLHWGPMQGLLKEEEKSKALMITQNRTHTGLDGIKHLISNLKEEVQTAMTPSAPFRDSLDGYSILIKQLTHLQYQEMAERCVWALGNLVASNLNNQEAVRQVGGVEVLVNLLSRVQSDTGVRTVSWALGNLAKGNNQNKAAIKQAHGIEVVVRLLGKSEDYESLKNLGRVLRYIAREKGGSYIPTFGERLSTTFRQMNLDLSPELAIMALGLYAVIMLLLVMLVIVILVRGSSGKRGEPVSTQKKTD